MSASDTAVSTATVTGPRTGLALRTLHGQGLVGSDRVCLHPCAVRRRRGMQVAFSRVCSRRTTTPVRLNEPRSYQLALATQGAFKSPVAQCVRGGGGLVLTDTSRPMENIGLSGYGAAEAIVLQIPRTGAVARLSQRRRPARRLERRRRELCA